ncbi:HlyD family secretion protein [gamma proteobacterium HdN1]|nr:HlyD family secretion protein [gamma proteobacterium HdN1]
MKRWILILTLLVIAAAGAFYWQKQGSKQTSDLRSTITVSRATLEDVVTAQGKLEPKNYVDVGAQVSGQIKKLYFEIGDRVQQGDLVAELDPRVYKAKVDADLSGLKSLQAQLREQEAQVKLAELQLQRTRKLLKSGTETQNTLEQNETSLKAARARLDSISAQIEVQRFNLEGDQTNLGYTQIYAPMDGTVVVQDVREGQTLNAMQLTPVILRLADLSEMTVRAQIAEADVSRLVAKMPVEFSTLGDLEKKWHAQLRQLLPTPEIVNDVVLFNALVDVDNTEGVLMSGMSTQLFFVVQRAENVLTLPRSALLRAVPGKENTYLVEVLESGHPQEKAVTIGMSNRTQVEIKDGLREGEQVVVRKLARGDASKPRMGGPRI